MPQKASLILYFPGDEKQGQKKACFQKEEDKEQEDSVVRQEEKDRNKKKCPEKDL